MTTLQFKLSKESSLKEILSSLLTHGSYVFGSIQKFDEWLNKSNFYFDNKPPISFLNTVAGVHFVDDRLTAMEYGDNV